MLGEAMTAQRRLYRVGFRERRARLIHDNSREMHVGLLVGEQTQKARRRSVDATLKRLRPYCVWTTTEDNSREFVRQ